MLFPQRVVIQSVLRRTTKPPCSPNSKQRVAQQHPSFPGPAVPRSVPPSPGHAVLGGPPRASPTSHHAAAVRSGAAAEATWAKSQPGGRWPGLEGCIRPRQGDLDTGRSQTKNSRAEPAWSLPRLGGHALLPCLWLYPPSDHARLLNGGNPKGQGMRCCPAGSQRPDRLTPATRVVHFGCI